MYKIFAKPIQNGKPLKFTVDTYTVKEGFVIFKDNVTGKTKRFAVSNCEIDEV